MRLVTVSLILLLSACVSNPNRGSDAEIASVNLDLGVRYYQQGELERAQQKLQKALDADDDLAAGHAAMALVLGQLGEVDKADEHYRRSLELVAADSADYGAFYNNYGVFLCGQGKSSEAEEYFTKAVANKRYPTPQAAYENAGACALQAGELDKGEKYFRRALQIDARMPRSLLGMAQLQLEKTRFLRARAYIQRYHAAAAATAESLWLGIRIERELGARDLETQLSQQLHDNFPDSDELQQYLNLIEGRNQP